MSEEPAGRRMVFFGATGIVAGALAWALASLLLGADGGEVAAGIVPALIGIAIAATIAALAARSLVRALRRRADELERVRREGEERLSHERRRSAALDRARRAERAWAAELRSQVLDLHRRQGPLGHHTGDTRELVLRVAISALDAEKGILFEREDGRVAPVCAEGFRHDPS